MQRHRTLWNVAKAALFQPVHAFSVYAKRYPATVGISCTVAKTAAADLFAQKVIEGKEQIDWRRNSVFSSFGFAYLGLWQYYLYAGIFPKIATRVAAVFGERAIPPALTFLDQCVHHPLMYFPCFYLLRGYVGGETAELSLQKCREDLWTNLKALWVVWVPSQFINFKYMPTYLQVPFVAAVSAGWCVIMSVFRGESATVAQKEEIERLQQLAAATAVAAAAAEASKEMRQEKAAVVGAEKPGTERTEGIEDAHQQQQQQQQQEKQDLDVVPISDPIQGGCMPLPVCRSFA